MAVSSDEERIQTALHFSICVIRGCRYRRRRLNRQRGDCGPVCWRHRRWLETADCAGRQAGACEGDSLLESVLGCHGKCDRARRARVDAYGRRAH